MVRNSKLSPSKPLPGSDNHAGADGGTRRSVIAAVFALVSAAGLAFDVLLVREGIPRIVTLLLSNSLTGAVAAGLFWQSRRREQERRVYVQRRLQVISELNHHIRNALQVLQFFANSPGAAQDENRMTAVCAAVERIEWALREVLPFDGDTPGPTAPTFTDPRSTLR
jgi:hypothetical protein